MLIAQLRLRNIQNIPYIFSICEVPEVLKLGKKNEQKRNLIYMTKNLFHSLCFLLKVVFLHKTYEVSV
ncbi:hypothetical protein HMPREF1254_0956 [Prevotella sp. BV3P1]|nr:hypothetical protein HMPREF1254_0956 [Prevotella sp. BV3P1]